MNKLASLAVLVCLGVLAGLRLLGTGPTVVGTEVFPSTTVGETTTTREGTTLPTIGPLDTPDFDVRSEAPAAPRRVIPSSTGSSTTQRPASIAGGDTTTSTRGTTTTERDVTTTTRLSTTTEADTTTTRSATTATTAGTPPTTGAPTVTTAEPTTASSQATQPTGDGDGAGGD